MKNWGQWKMWKRVKREERAVLETHLFLVISPLEAHFKHQIESKLYMVFIWTLLSFKRCSSRNKEWTTVTPFFMPNRPGRPRKSQASSVQRVSLSTWWHNSFPSISLEFVHFHSAASTDTGVLHNRQWAAVVLVLFWFLSDRLPIFLLFAKLQLKERDLVVLHVHSAIMLRIDRLFSKAHLH